MKATLLVLLCLMLAACDTDDTKKDAAVATDSDTADTGATPDKKVVTPDNKIVTPDNKVTPPDQKVTPPDQKATPPDQKVTPDKNTNPPPTAWGGQLTKLTCWCNKMPPGSSNIIMVEATVINGTKSPITGVKAVKSSFEVVGTGKPISVTFKADPPFAGTVPGASKAAVKLRAQGSPTAVPIPCTGTIKVTTSFSSNLGTTGPLTTAQATCQTVY